MEPLDAIDQQIVRQLQHDGRASYADLARTSGLSTSAAHQRVRRLEERGVVTGYRASVDYARCGLPMSALIAVTPLDPAGPDDIPERLEHVSEIEACWSVAGEHSYYLLARVATPAALEDLLSVIRTKGRCSTRTTVVLSTPWEGRPVAALPDDDGPAGG